MVLLQQAGIGSRVSNKSGFKHALLCNRHVGYHAVDMDCWTRSQKLCRTGSFYAKYERIKELWASEWISFMFQYLWSPKPWSDSKHIQYRHLWCFSTTALLASNGFMSTQYFSVTIMHDLMQGRVILDCSIWFPPESLLNRHAQNGCHWTTGSVWVYPFTSFTEKKAGSHEVSHPVEHMCQKGTKKPWYQVLWLTEKPLKRIKPYP